MFPEARDNHKRIVHRGARRNGGSYSYFAGEYRARPAEAIFLCWRVAAAFFGGHAADPEKITQHVAIIKLCCHSGAHEVRTRNLEIPGSMLSHRPGMTA